MNYSNRIFLYGPLMLLLLIAVAVMVWWKIVASSFDERLAAANGREIMPGVRMSYASKDMEGFPFRVDSVMEGFTLQVQTRTGPLVWRAEHFAIHALTYGRDQQVFEAAGTQTLWWTDSGGEHHRWTFVPGPLRASAILAHGRLSRFDLDAVAIASAEFSATRLQFHLRQAPDRDALEFVMTGDNLRRTIGGQTSTAQDLSIEGNVAPGHPVAALLGGEVDWRSAAEAWRQRGGTLSIERIETLQDRIKTTGEGQLSLDGLRRLQGRIALTYQAPESVTRLGQYPTDAERRYYWVVQSGYHDASGRPRLVYVFDDGHIYYNSVAPKNIVTATTAARRAFLFVVPQSQVGDLADRVRAAIDRDAIVLHPLY